MAEPAGPFHLLRAGPGRYLCYCLPGPGPGGTVYVTDALEVWAAELGAPPAHTQPSGGPGPALAAPQRCPPQERGARLREALGRGAAALSLAGAPATLQLREEAARCSALDLVRLPGGEARSQLQGLVFGMARRIQSLEERLEAAETRASSCSPEKNTARSQQLSLPDPSPRKNRSAGSVLPAKRKIPGESLINPGFKSKKAPSGVDFEDS